MKLGLFGVNLNEKEFSKNHVLLAKKPLGQLKIRSLDN